MDMVKTKPETEKLVTILKMERYKKIEIFQDGKRVYFNGNYYLPAFKEFNTPEEAKAFIEGIKWTVEYYDGDVSHYMKGEK